MQQYTFEKLRDAFMPLIRESIDKANWNHSEWIINQWAFNITVGHDCHKFRLRSSRGIPGESPTRYLPLVEEEIEYTENNPLPGNYFVQVLYTVPSEAVVYSSSLEVYNPVEDKDISEWSKRIITEAKMHVANMQTE